MTMHDKSNKSKIPRAPAIDVHGETDRGRRREANEDQFMIAELNKSLFLRQSSVTLDETREVGRPQGQLFLVADGMGGHASGEEASAIAVETVRHHVLNMMPWFFKLDRDHSDELREELRSLYDECQARIEQAVARHPEREGMGTTLTMAYVLWPNAWIVHVGDSRCYLMRDEKLEQITTDHTLAQQLVDDGVLDAQEAEDTRFSHLLWNAVGGNEKAPRPDVYRARLEPSDALLLATDGLTKHVSDEVIREELARTHSAEDSAKRLVDAANRGGGTDNITVVVARLDPSMSRAALVDGDDLDASRMLEIRPQPVRVATGAPAQTRPEAAAEQAV